MVEAAHSATRTKTYLAAQFRRLATRRGPKKAMVAVAHTILVIAYHLLLHDHPFEDLGETYFDNVNDRLFRTDSSNAWSVSVTVCSSSH